MKEQFEMSLKKRQTCCAGNFAIFLNLQFAISSSLDVCKHFAQDLNRNFDSSIYDRSLGALRAPTSSLRPFGSALGLLDFVLRALWALRPCDPRNVQHTIRV